MSLRKLYDRWRRRYSRCLQRQEILRRRARQTGGPEDVHDLRVVLRRLRLFVRLASPFIGQHSAIEYATWSRGLSQATSAVRDHDVALEWLQVHPAGAELTRELRTSRARLWRACRPALRPLSRRLRHRLSDFRTSGKTRRRFSQRYARRFERLSTRVRPRIAIYGRLKLEDRHAFRRSLRQMRYMRELAVAGAKQEPDPLLSLLLRVQAAMGELQNLQLVAALAGTQLDGLETVAVKRLLARDTRRWKREIREGLQALASGLGA